MAVILADGILNYIFLNENDRISIHVSLKHDHRRQIDNKPALVKAANRWQAITCTIDDPVHWRIYVALGEMS